MIKPFKNDYALTQGWGVNGQDYARFGLKGHNGTDWALPTGTEVLAPHDGKVLEVANDPTGYGNYIKIESSIEGSLVAHLKSFNVKVGDQVKQGDLLGLSNNTGNSTGPHLHWGYYRIPRNRQDGYAGYIDPFPYITAPSPANSITLDSKTFEMLVTKATERDDVLLPKIKQLDNDLQKEKEEVLRLNGEITELKKANISLLAEKEIMAKAQAEDAIHDRDAEVKNTELEHKITELNKQIEDLKAEKTAPVEPVIEHYESIIEKLWPNLYKSKKARSLVDRIWRWIS